MLSSELNELISSQRGLVTMPQLAAHGFRSDMVARRVETRNWVPVTCRVIATSPLPLDRRALLWAASLHYPNARLAGASALEIEGLPESRDGAIHLVGTRTGRTAPLLGCVMHTQIVEQAGRSGPDRVDPLSAVVQALMWARTDAQGVFQAVWALQHRLVTHVQVQAAVHALPAAPGSAAARRRAALLVAGADSVYELEFARGCRDRGLPEPVRQRQRQDSEGRTRYTDVEFSVDGQAVVVEIDGLHHIDASVRIDDDWRANELTMQGTPVLRVTALALRTNPERVYAQVRRAIARLRRAA